MGKASRFAIPSDAYNANQRNGTPCTTRIDRDAWTRAANPIHAAGGKATRVATPNSDAPTNSDRSEPACGMCHLHDPVQGCHNGAGQADVQAMTPHANSLTARASAPQAVASSTMTLP